IFDPALGGDPVLFQHMFWFYSHPAVYIMILPGMGVISETLTCFSRKNIFGYHAVAWSSVGIAVVGFLLWAHHMFVAGISFYAALLFSLLSMLVAVPSAIKVFNWTATLYRGSITFQAPMLFSIGFLVLFFGDKAPANPWSATGLEWASPSPPTVHNFEAMPVVVCGPYEYAIGVDQMGRGLPEPPGPGGATGPSGHEGPTGPAGPMKKETE